MIYMRINRRNLKTKDRVFDLLDRIGDAEDIGMNFWKDVWKEEYERKVKNK
jgi:hypothetical protein